MNSYIYVSFPSTTRPDRIRLHYHKMLNLVKKELAEQIKETKQGYSIKFKFNIDSHNPRIWGSKVFTTSDFVWEDEEKVLKILKEYYWENLVAFAQ